MANYGIDVFNFEFWEGPAPVIPSQKVATFHRPGAPGVSHQLLGTWGEQFQCTLTSHWATQLDALTAYDLMRNLIGTGGKWLKYNNLNFTGLHGVTYNVDNVELLELRAHLWLVGPGYSYPNGASMQTRFTLSPQ